jgi:hypothetical protein
VEDGRAKLSFARPADIPTGMSSSHSSCPLYPDLPTNSKMLFHVKMGKN